MGLRVESEVATRKKWAKVKKPPSNAVEALEICDEGVYPNLHKLLIILCTLPVTTATAEISFSGMRRLKTYLRSTMNQTHLLDWPILASTRISP